MCEQMVEYGSPTGVPDVLKVFVIVTFFPTTGDPVAQWAQRPSEPIGSGGPPEPAGFFHLRNPYLIHTPLAHFQVLPAPG